MDSVYVSRSLTFQSLIGRLLTKGVICMVKSDVSFQSLIGRLLTDMNIDVLRQRSSFNPS